MADQNSYISLGRFKNTPQKKIPARALAFDLDSPFTTSRSPAVKNISERLADRLEDERQMAERQLRFARFGGRSAARPTEIPTQSQQNTLQKNPIERYQEFDKNNDFDFSENETERALANALLRKRFIGKNKTEAERSGKQKRTDRRHTIESYFDKDRNLGIRLSSDTTDQILIEVKSVEEFEVSMSTYIENWFQALWKSIDTIKSLQDLNVFIEHKNAKFELEHTRKNKKLARAIANLGKANRHAH